ncbi:MAG: hypothetical protein WC335_04710 [Candidatus Omnitrophota bacterium]|jgi:hypothetical protein
MKKRVILLIIASLAFVLLPLLTESMAQQVANPKGNSYKGVANFYSQRFFPVGQVAQIDTQKVEANAAGDEQATGDGSTINTLPKVGDTKVIKDANGQDVEMVLKNIAQDGDQVTMDWEPVSGEGDSIGETVNVNVQNAQAGESPIVMPKVSGPEIADSGTDIQFSLDGTLDKTQLSELQAWVVYDDKPDGENWDLNPSMISDDGKSITMNFDPKFEGQTVSLQFYALDKDGKKTNVADAVTVKINGTNPTDDTGNGTIDAAYDADAGTITYTADGEEKIINIADVGLSADWMKTLTGLGGKLSVTENEDGSVKLITGSDDSGAKKWEYDPSAHLVAHYEGEAGSEKCTVVTSEETYDANYLWGSDTAADPGEGPDGHFVVQRFNYDDSGNLETVDYFTWAGGNRGGLHPADHKAVFGVDLTKTRYMYRQDTVVSSATDSDEVTANCTSTGDDTTVTTKYFNDPFPEDWDPVLTGTVAKDEYGNYWLDTGCEKYLLVCATDGYDADSDGKSGADEMNDIDWENLVGKEITVRGNEIASDSESGLYYEGEAAQMFEVVDIITPEEKESLGDDYETTLANMEAVAAAVDPVHEGLIGSGESQGTLGVLNLFNGSIPTTDQLTDDAQTARRITSLAAAYNANIDADTLDAISAFATDALKTALEDAANAATEAENTTDTTTDATTTTDTTDTTTTDTTDAATNTVTTTTTDADATQAVDDLLEKSVNWLKQFTNGGEAI